MQSFLSVNTNLSLFSITIAPSTFLATVTLCLVFLALYLPPLRPFFGGGSQARSSPIHPRRYYQDYHDYYDDDDADDNNNYQPQLPANKPTATITNRLTSYLTAWANQPAPIELRDHPPLIEGLPRARTTTSRWASLASKSNKDKRIALRASIKTSPSSKRDGRARIESNSATTSTTDALRPGRRRFAAIFGRLGRPAPPPQQQHQQQQPFPISLRLPVQHNDQRLSPPARRQHPPQSPPQQQHGQPRWWGWLLASSVAPPRQRRQIERVLAQGRG